MHISDFSFLNEKPCHNPAIEHINASAFGPGRHTLAAARIREKGTHQLEHSYVCVFDDEVIGSVRMTPIWIGDSACYMLGPLAVLSKYKKMGIGRKLVSCAVTSVAELDVNAVLLVGDAPYYEAVGFAKSVHKITFPGPVDPDRILLNDFGKMLSDSISGNVAYRKA